MRWLLLILFLSPSIAEAVTTVVYIDGCEVGQFLASAYAATGGTPACDTAHVRSGAYALKFTATGDFVSIPFNTVVTTDVFIRFGVYVTGTPGSNFILGTITNSGGTNGAQLNLLTSGKLSFTFTGGATIATSTNALNTNAWNLIELHMVKSLTVGGMELKLNGTTEFTSFGTNTNGVAMDRWATGTITGFAIWMDDFCIRIDQYCGDGHVIARQGTSGSPTFNAWTKNACAGGTIDGCWSDTPPSTGSNASTVTAVTKQTMKVANFNTTQTGHGSEIITAASVIQGAVVYGYQNCVAGGVQYIEIIGGVETDQGSNNPCTGNQQGMGGGSGFQTIFFPTAAQLSNSGAEIGAISGAGATNVTVNDMWLMVDYLGGGVVPHKVHHQ